MFAGLKKCLKCGKRKKIELFNLTGKKHNQRRADCGSCSKQASKKRYEDKRTDPESIARKIVTSSKGRTKKKYAKLFKKQKSQNNKQIKLSAFFDLDYKWVLEQCEKQNNKCYYTGVEMIWSTGYIDDFKRIDPSAVTIERMDSSKGYTKDNCVLACWWANCSKGAGTYEELIKFSLATINYYEENKK